MHATTIDRRLILSAIWVGILFVFAYVDIFQFYRSDILSQALQGRLSGMGFLLDQRFLLLTTIYILPACLMIPVTLSLSAGVSRIVNIVVAVLYAITIMLAMLGENWWYFQLGSVVELVMLGWVVAVAWQLGRSSRHPSQPVSEFAQ